MAKRQSPFDNYQQLPGKTLFLDWLLISLGLFLIFLAFAQGQGWLEKEPAISLTTVSEAASEREGETIFVDIAGAVEKPGLYELPSGTRVNDLILACGGLTGWVSRSFLEKSLNRARLLQDGEKVNIPYQGQEESSEVLADDQTPNNKININQASHQELMTLSGIGAKYAQEIIDYRQSVGPFGSIDEIMQVKGIGEKTFADIKDRIEI
jgi:competence protein ComEA